MKKTTFLIILTLLSIFLYSQTDFRSSNSTEYTQSKSSLEIIKDVNQKIEIMEIDYDIDEPTEIGYSKSGMGTKFDKSDDLYAYALELHDLAESGDSEAQYYLAYVISHCYSPELPTSEFDSALSIELNDWMRTRCAGFFNQGIESLGEIEYWIKRSSQSKYPQALVANLIIQDELPLTSAVLSDIQLALKSKSGEVMNLLGSFGHPQKNRIANEAWKILACDYGRDCTERSKDIWRFHLGATCSIKMMTSEECKTNIDYITYSKSHYTSEEFKQIMNKVASLRAVITSDRISELTFEQILD